MDLVIALGMMVLGMTILVVSIEGAKFLWRVAVYGSAPIHYERGAETPTLHQYDSCDNSGIDQ